MIANSRIHMGNLLDDRMRRSMVKSRTQGNGDRDSNRVKTHIIEATLPEDSAPEKTVRFVKDLFLRLGTEETARMVIRPATNEAVVTIQIDAKGEEVTAYLDTTNPRFWLLHSMARSETLDVLVNHWIDDLPELDRAWFPIGLLDKFSSGGVLRGIGIEYNNSWMKRRDLVGDESDMFKMQVRSRHAGRVLSTMRSEHGEPNVSRLSKVTVESRSGEALSDIKYDGKITGLGKSFSDHLAVVSGVLEQYSSEIRRVEADYSISGKFADGRLTIEGSPIFFKLPTSIDNLVSFSDAMFSAAAPFRLWGNPVVQSEELVSVNALDLHSARTVAFEITKNFLRAYLPKGSCGNSILRLYTNLQGRYDARVEVVNGEGEAVFGF